MRNEQDKLPRLLGSGVHFSGFDSALYRNHDAKWDFPQENASSHHLQMAPRESKPL
jgi:hypothetical protein